MSLFHVLAGATLAVIAVLHSVLGERVIIRPLLADDRWDVGVPRPAAERILRFAWHVTSIAWLAGSATAFGVDGTVALTVAALVTALLVVVMLRSHLAWPLFLLVALWGAVATELAGPVLLGALALATAVAAAGAALLHVAWATGHASAAAAGVVPTRPEGGALFTPSRTATLLVAAALTVFAGALTVLVLDPTAVAARLLVAGATVVLALRTAGDGRYVGFSKRIRTTPFARLDDAVLTPVVAVLTVGGAAALAL